VEGSYTTACDIFVLIIIFFNNFNKKVLKTVMNKTNIALDPILPMRYAKKNGGPPSVKIFLGRMGSPLNTIGKVFFLW
jgi:hypothetical protein